MTDPDGITTVQCPLHKAVFPVADDCPLCLAAPRRERTMTDPNALRDQVAQETAESIARQPGRAQADTEDYRVLYRDAQRPPEDVQAIKQELLSGHVWVSWLDPKVADAMRLMHGAPVVRIVTDRRST